LVVGPPEIYRIVSQKALDNPVATSQVSNNTRTLNLEPTIEHAPQKGGCKVTANGQTKEGNRARNNAKDTSPHRLTSSFPSFSYVLCVFVCLSVSVFVSLYRAAGDKQAIVWRTQEIIQFSRKRETL
jgi:hypothetical protein